MTTTVADGAKPTILDGAKPTILNEAVSVLMPICNERDVIVAVVEEWARDVFANLPAGSELVFDDCSNDGTSAILVKLAERYRFIRINCSPRDGFGCAAKRLYGLARCPLVFFTDSDGQYVPADFWKLAHHISAVDMVHGYKVNRQDPRYRLIASGLFNILVRMLFCSRGHDVNSAFRLIRRPLIERVLPEIRHLPPLPNAELYIRGEWLGYRILDMPTTHRKRLSGQSRGLPPTSFFGHAWRTLWGLWRLRKELRLGAARGSVLATPKP